MCVARTGRPTGTSASKEGVELTNFETDTAKSQNFEDFKYGDYMSKRGGMA